jgi:opacity protein-like surface antigen
METVLTEQHFQEKSGLTDRNTMAALRRATNARFVLAGTISRLGTTNLFDVKILDIETGRQVEGGGAYRQYTNLADGIDLMGELAYELTGKEAGRYAENRQQERQAADAERKRQDDAQRQQEEDERSWALYEFLWGGERLLSIGANFGLGLGNEAGLDLNGFANFNVTVPLIWNLFADVGVNLGLFGSIGKEEYHNSLKYSAIRPYGRLNVGIPLDFGILILPYAGIGFGYLKATYDFNYEVSLVKGKATRAHEYTGIDAAVGIIANWGHHGIRLGVSLNNVIDKEYFEPQVTLGYLFRF